MSRSKGLSDRILARRDRSSTWRVGQTRSPNEQYPRMFRFSRRRSRMITSTSLPLRWRNTISDWARSHQEITEVWLFGSRARNRSTIASDIDLAIRLRGRDEGDRYALWMGRRRWMRLLELPVSIDLQYFDPDEVSERVGPAVKKDGIPIFIRR